MKIASAVVVSACTTVFMAPEFAWGQAIGGSDIVVTGTRASGLSVNDSPTPVEVLGAHAITSQGRPELINALANLLPSLNVQAVGFDLANETLSIRMRGLSPNHTLVLVNGKRLHGTANLAVLSGPYQGGAAPDLNFVSKESLSRIEVLKDGAAAQYGSDAIAGVVNLMLRRDDSGASVKLTQGGYYKGDGKTTDLSANLGMKLGTAGFLNVTAGVVDHGFSNAGGPDQRVERLIASGDHPEWANLPGYPLLNKVFGDARYRLYLATVNAGMPLSDGAELYAFGTYGHKKAGGWANFRLPTKLPALYPKGFSPIDWVISDDLSLSTGVKAEIDGWSLDVGSTYGFNRNRVEVTGSANIDLFNETGSTPRDFYNGNLNNSQWTLNLDLSRPLHLGLHNPATLALGGEFRRETYTIQAGNPASRYKAGSQSFPGFSITDAGKISRRVGAIYANLVLAPARRVQIDLAARYEHYSDFGSALVGKASGRLELNEALALRGTVSNGFRAPTLAEERYSATNVQPNSAFVQLPPYSSAARLIGIDALRPEKSTNFNLGFVANPVPFLRLSVDAYQIAVRNRIVGSGTLYGTYAGQVRSAAVNAAIIANGNTLEAVPFSGINVFTNGINTKTKGVDLILSLQTDVGEGRIEWSLAANYNRTKVTRIRKTPQLLAASGQQLFDKVAISTLEDASPRYKIGLSANYARGPFSIGVTNTLYGQSSRYADPGDGRYYLDKAGRKIITDLNVSYRLTKRVTLSAGANNLFDILPDRINSQGLAASAAAGNPAVEIYPSFSPFGINGGYWYARLAVNY